MANRTKKVKDGKVFTIYLDKPHLEHMKSVAHRMSQQEGRDISTCEAIRMALEIVYPMAKQMEMFETKKQREKREFQERMQMNFMEVKKNEQACAN